jgi:hypothetical protein
MASRGKLWTVIAVFVAIGCGGKEEVEGPPVGSCSLGGGMWSCTSAVADSGGSWSQCPSNVGQGSSCSVNDTTTDTTNPTQPAHYSNTNCFMCTSNGLGVVWTCTSGVWETGEVFSCSP